MDFLFYLATVGENLLRWRLRGRTTSPGAFQSFLWGNTEFQFIIVRNSDQKPIGHVCTYQTDEFARHAHVAGALIPEVQREGWPLQGFWIFLNYLFFACPFEKVYFEAPEFNRPMLAKFFDQVTIEEGRLRDAVFWQGEFVDVVISSLSRVSWMEGLSTPAGRFFGRNTEAD